MRAVLGPGGSACDSSPTAASVAGLGRVSVSCHVASDHRSAYVVFWRVSGPDGLEYAAGYPPLPTSCVAHLGGPWWQLAHPDPVSESCPRGFHFTPGG